MDNSLTIYYCGTQKCLPNHSYGPAVRTHYLIHFIFKGCGIFFEGNNQHKLGIGDSFLIRPGEPTTYTADENDPWSYGWIGFDGRNVDSVLKECGLLNKHTFTFKKIFEEVSSSFYSLNKNFSQHKRHPLLMLSNMYDIFYQLSILNEKSSKISNNDYVDLATSYIQTHFHKNISVSAIAEYIGIERTYLYRLFMKNLQVSPLQYLIMYRINVSLKLLENSSLPITTIALSCGFNDASTYCRHFKQIIKITPSNYRKNVQS